MLLAIVNSSGLALSVDSIKINQIHKLLYIVIGHFQINVELFDLTMRVRAKL